MSRDDQTEFKGRVVHPVPWQYEKGKFGVVEDLDAGDDPSDIWPVGDDTGVVKTFPVLPTAFYISSSSAADTAVALHVHYIDDDGLEQTIDYTHTTGQTPATLDGITGLDVDRVHESGSVAAAGDIYVTVASNHTAGVPDDTAQILAVIPVGFGQTQQCMFIVPLDFYARINSVQIGVNRANGALGSAVLSLEVKKYGETWLVKRHLHVNTGDGMEPITVTGLGRVPARTKIRLRVISVSDLNTSVTGVINWDKWNA